MYTLFRLCLFVVLFVSFNSWSQTVVNGVVMRNEMPLYDVEVVDTFSGKMVKTDVHGAFTIELEKAGVLEFSRTGYTPSYFTVSGKEDTLNCLIELMWEPRKLAEVVITAEGIVKVGEQKEENTLDYLLYDDYMVILKTRSRKRYLTFETVDSVLLEFDLGKRKIGAIQEDCYGNIHLLNKDSTYQIWIENGQLYTIDSASIEQFYYTVATCLTDFEESTVFANYSGHNKRYTLTKIDKSTGEKRFFYYSTDSIGEAYAASYYNEILSGYHNSVIRAENIVIHGMWDGDLRKLALFAGTWYYNVCASELDVSSYRVGDEIHTFDCFADSIMTFDQEGNQLSSVFFELATSKRSLEIIHDRAEDKSYGLELKGGVYSIYRVDSKSGKSKYLRNLSEMPFPENIQVHKNKIYFLFREGSYNKLFSLKL